MGVGGDTNHLTVDLLELLDPIRECDDLSGTHECEVERIEVDHEVLSFVILQRHLLELTSNNSLGLERWSWLLNLGSKKRGGRKLVDL